MNKKTKISKEWVLKYAEIEKLDKKLLLQLLEDEMLSRSALITKLVRNDYAKLQSNLELTKTEIKTLLANRYEVSASHIETILYNKNNRSTKKYYCFQCDAEITKYNDQKNKGLCGSCVTNNKEEQLFHSKFRQL